MRVCSIITTMNAAHYKQLLPVITHFANGGEVQILLEGIWIDSPGPSFQHSAESYRIKPEPKQVLMTVDDLPDGPIWLRGPNLIELVTVFHEDGSFESDTWKGTIETCHANGDTWSTSRKGPWHPFTKTVEEA